MPAELTVAMTPSFYYDGDWLLKAQLKCLSEQQSKEFDVYLIDAHYTKRKHLIPDYAQHYKLNLIHIPYVPNPNRALRLNCEIFNAPYLYSESKKIVRYSCWRFCKPTFTKVLLESNCNVDFFFHSLDFAPKHPETDHPMDVWNFGSDKVNWNKVPFNSDKDQPETLFPSNCYGNYMVYRDQWLSINGVNEIPFGSDHFEDQDFCARARNKGLTCKRLSNHLYRLHHRYGNKSNRSNVTPDAEYKNMCVLCQCALNYPKPNRYNIDNRFKNGEIEIFKDKQIWICKQCHLAGPIYYEDEGTYLKNLTDKNITDAFILPKYKLGRNLRILAADLDGKSIEEKVKVFNESHNNPRYYNQ